MLIKKPLVIAISAAGLCVAVENVMAVPPTTFQSLCGTTISTSTFLNCSGSETLAADCTILVGTGGNLGINACQVDADGHKVVISGNWDTAFGLTLGSNWIHNASKIDINFKGSSTGACGSPVIYANYDMESSGNITMYVGCGGISVDLPYGSGLDAGGNLLSLKTGNGNITVDGNGQNFLMSTGALGAIKVEAGGDGVATVGDTVSLTAKQIKVFSNGGVSVVENTPPPDPP